MQIQLSSSEPFQQQQQQQHHHHVSSTYGQSTTTGNSGSSNNLYPPYRAPSSSQHTPEVDEMNQYPQYSGSYGQSHQQQQQQQQQQHHQSSQHPPQRPFLPNPLPHLGPGMGPPGMGMPAHVPYMPAQQPPMAQQPQSLPAPSTRPGVGNPPQQDRKMSSTSVKDGHRYSLDVVQQPQRARMCGFGDKDRRPITPPPCVRLVITDAATGDEVSLDDLGSDPSFYVLQVDLWADDALREANVVRASSNSPAVSISSATTTSYPPPVEASRMMNDGHQMMHFSQDNHSMYMQGYAVPLARPMPVQQFGQSMYYPQMPGTQQYIQPAQTSSAMYTRNLIGSLTVNASQLKDPENKAGYWFVLQDLSVRTEGFFRLRMSFIDISNGVGGSGVNRGKAPVLAWTFSEVFQVYSAKKFPGVIESTPLSKTFASQGIKIPIRKDNKTEQADEDDGE